jgi:hypothetical protein
MGAQQAPPRTTISHARTTTGHTAHLRRDKPAFDLPQTARLGLFEANQ